MEKAIKITPLLESKVFNHVFDFDDWPGNHWNETECIRPYNGSFFNVRHAYLNVFAGEEFKPMDNVEPEKEGEQEETKKVFKIKYSINLLQQVGFYITENKDDPMSFHNEEI